MIVKAIVPARGGSKGVPNKNIKLLNGKPLIQYTLEFISDLEFVDEIIISTDSSDIRKVVESLGYSIRQLRPIELGEDHVSDFPVIEHALNELQSYPKADALMYMRPTTPFRSRTTAEKMICKLKNEEIDSVRSIRKVKEHPYWMKEFTENEWRDFIEGKNETIYYQRQLLPELYTLAGSIDVFNAENISNNNIYGEVVDYYVDDQINSIDIDTIQDWKVAEYLLNEGKVNEEH